MIYSIFLLFLTKIQQHLQSFGDQTLLERGRPYRAKVQGNPSCYAVWEDESFNHHLARVAANIHPANFESRLLLRANYVEHEPSPS
eukprot:2786670-Amphidinium_carterae.1